MNQQRNSKAVAVSGVGSRPIGQHMLQMLNQKDLVDVRGGARAGANPPPKRTPPPSSNG